MSSEDLLDHGHRIAALERRVSELYERLGQAEPGSATGLTFASDEAAAGAGDDPRVAQLLEAGNKIAAIKLYRELTGTGLKEAKDAVDQLEATR